ncbi:MAG: hypothetical protein IJK14_05480 [Clostridia bacterium]|nr:hypothetical protein [Clostridia bacterium]
MNRFLYGMMASLLLACGCSSGMSTGQSETPPAVSPSVSPATSLIQDTLSFSESDTLSGFTASSGLLPHHILSVEPGVTLDADGLSLDKVNNEATEITDDALYTGSEAMIFTDNSIIRLNNSMISGTAPYAHALWLGNQSTCSMQHTILVTTDIGQAAVAAFDGSSLDMTDCILASTGDGAFCLMLLNSHAFAAKSEFTVRDSQTSYSVSLGNSVLSLSDSNLSGNIQYSDPCSVSCSNSALTAELFAEGSDAELSLSLISGSVLTGRSYDDSALSLNISLDESSTWNLTEDSFVAEFHDADQSLSNIISNGYSLYYNSEYEGNEWLSNRTFSLPGGGYLIPLI